MSPGKFTNKRLIERLFTVDNIAGLTLIMLGVAVLARPTVGAIAFMANRVAFFSAEMFALFCFVCGGLALVSRLTGVMFYLLTSPIMIFAGGSIWFAVYNPLVPFSSSVIYIATWVLLYEHAAIKASYQGGNFGGAKPK